MVRTFRRKTTPVDKEQLKKAIVAVKRDNCKIMVAAKQFGIARSTLSGWLKKNNGAIAHFDDVAVSHHGGLSIMDSKSESTLVEYLAHCNEMYFGLSTKEMRGLAFDFAKKLNLKVPASWEAARMAGEDWLTNFLKRHRTLSIRKPEARSLTRDTSFNRTNVERFFALLKSMLDKYRFPIHCIWNMDETGITTVQTPNRIIGRVKQIERVSSAERGNLVTLTMAVSAIGQFLPPFFIFPRKHFKEYFLNGGLPGCTGEANPNGWMNAQHFVKFLQFFQSHVRASVDDPVLLILDNHESHLSIAGLDYCKANGIIVLSSPPHCSHKLQPLKRTVYDPLKKCVNAQCDNWITSNPGRTMTMYDIPGIVAKALPLAVTYQNIVSGFECTGISPFNPDIFQEYEFLPNSVTDREYPFTFVDPEKLYAADQNKDKFDSTDLSMSHYSDTLWGNLNATTLESIPEAAPKQPTHEERRTSVVLTDSPQMRELATEQAESGQKENEKPATRKRGRPQKNATQSEPQPSTSGEQESKSEKSSDCDEDLDNICCVCSEATENRDDEKQCISRLCKRRAHNKCVRSSDAVFTCFNCLNDTDDEESN
ncbi:uncharacterized protein [Temnothorax nylanderi]|uniref:uncharacterized protein isoform X2 n=1 Tax=Temnothorax nylanderi TaxID=102681 RepID=UPI003A8AF5DD